MIRSIRLMIRSFQFDDLIEMIITYNEHAIFFVKYLQNVVMAFEHTGIVPEIGEIFGRIIGTEARVISEFKIEFEFIK